MATPKQGATNPQPTSAQVITNSKAPTSTPVETNGFKRTMSLFDLLVYGAIMLVPVGLFSIYGNVFNESHGMPGLAYIIGFILIIPTAFAFGALIRKWPSSGSVFTYCANGMSKGWGFLAGWMLLLQYIIYPDLMYILAGHALNQVWPSIPVWAFAAGILVFVTIVSLMKLNATNTINKVALAAQLIVVALFIFFAVRFLLAGDTVVAPSADTLIHTPGIEPGGIAMAVGLCALSYLGFGSIATFTEEAKHPYVDPPRATWLTVICVGALFITVSVLAQLVDPEGALFAHDTANGFYLVAGAIGGKWFGTVCAVANALAMGLFSGLAGVVSVSRVIYIMGKADALPRWVAHLNPKTHAPRNASIAVAALSAALLFALLPFGMDTVTTICNFGALSTYLLVDVCVVWYFWVKKHDRSNAFTKLLLPAFGALAIGAIMISLGLTAHIVGLCWAGAGVVIYLVLTRGLHRDINLGNVS